MPTSFPGISRRALLAGSLAAGLSTRLHASTAPAAPGTLPTIAEMEAHTGTLAAAFPDLVETRVLGTSRTGRPIELVSIGSGPKSALMVGAPHPNEPIGCATVERLMDMLVRDTGLRDSLGYRWHFIKAIDIDGIALNEGWMKKPLTPRAYFHDFFRPAFDEQPDYTFPMKTPGYTFDRSTPENRCWQAALDYTRPTLQCSLHGADSGGVFYILSRNIPELVRALSSQPAEAGVTLSTVGEPFAGMAPLGQGVFGFPDFEQEIQAALSAGLPATDAWHAGSSSADYAAERYGTFSMICEVTLWDDDRLRDSRLSSFSIKDILLRQIAVNAETLALLNRWLPDLRRHSETSDERALLSALIEAATTAARQNSRFGPLLEANKEWSELLSIQMYACIEMTLRLVGLRPFGSMAHLCRLILTRRTETNISAAAQMVAQVLEAHFDRLDREAPLRALPLEVPVGIQVQALLTAARLVR
jgi:hypothetical protein